MKTDEITQHSVEEIRQALENATFTKTVEPDAYAAAAQQFVDEYGADLHMLLVESECYQPDNSVITG